MELTSSKALRRYNHLSGELDGVYHGMSRRLGLTDSAMIILYTILDCGERCPLREICRLSGLSKQTVNSALRKLEGEGAVYLEAGGRHKTVCLTREGEALAHRTAGRILELENRIFDSWPEEDVERYLALTERFLLQLREGAKNIEGGEK